MTKPQTIDAYLDTLNPDLAEIGQALARIITTNLPQTTGKVWHGHPVWMNDKTPVAGFKAFTTYVTLMIWQGQDIEDATGSLKPGGAGRMASVKYHSIEEIDESAISAWFAQLD